MYANKKILLVDDESALRRTMTLGLSQHGIDTEPCENGVNALKKLETYIKHNTTLDGIVVDIQLPDINGIKLVKIMKFKYPGVPIILISGHADKYNIDEIQDLQISAFLEKPFSPAELTAQFLEIMAEQQVVEAPAVEEDEATSESAYVLARLENSADFADTHHKLSYMDNVLYCDATKGDYDVIMLVNAPNMEDLRKMTDSINAVPGVESASLLEVANPMLDETTLSAIEAAEAAFDEDPKARDMSRRASSYLLLDVEREKLNDIYPTLKLDEKVIYCDYTTGTHNMVLFISGNYYDQIDSFIKDKIINMDGVLKAKEYPIVSFTEM